DSPECEWLSGFGSTECGENGISHSREDDSPECEWLSGFGSTECGETGISQKQEGRLTCRSTRREDN
ncbi:hypothetical protein, partial [Waltera sp.]|uniref:hypothetical protein n=1 Tax=Waltera sp. TaxID=2815806 RepID=UPI003077677A